MKKFLVVGCGGSGGATLSYLMDELRSELALHGVDRIPQGWQFIHIDVPVADTREAEGVGSVRELGGTYYGTGAKGISYSVLDAGVSQALQQSGGLGAIGTWAPRAPESVGVGISAGAGQYRAVGRMITLSKASGIRQALEDSWGSLKRGETNDEMRRLVGEVPGLGEFNGEADPIVLVVSSMAGGAGASMAIDVCRLLTLIPGLDPSLLGIFMVTADVFDPLPPSARTGVRANALAMLGEIVATQSGAARPHDVAALAALGHQNGEGAPVPFKRVFPVGRHVGAQRTPFGDGSSQAVYRGLGRGLAGMMSSGTATEQFVAYDLVNTGSPSGNRDFLGWGVQWDPIPWGSFGFASLSMGRERYREYAAQRLARTAVDRLVEGHMQVGNTESSSKQVARLLDSQWARICDGLGLPASDTTPMPPQRVLEWFTGRAYPRAQVEFAARKIVEDEFAAYVPSPGGIPVAQWIPTLRQRLSERRSAVTTGISRSSHQWAFAWQQEFTESTIAAVESGVATFGIPYGLALLERIESHIKNVVAPGLHELSERAPADLTALPSALEAKLGALRGVVTNAQDVVDQLAAAFKGVFRDGMIALSAGIAEKVALGAIGGLIEPLRASLREGLRGLELARGSDAQHLGLALLATDIYGAWPSDADPAVPSRFDVANNDVLITKSVKFPDQYRGDIVGAVDGANDFSSAASVAVTQVISGEWPTTGATAPPRGLLTIRRPWRSAVFAVNPNTNEVEVPSDAALTLHVKPGEILSRARLFVLRPGVSFDRFCSVSLRDYVSGVGATESEIQVRQADIGAKFRDALVLARPLISVSPTAVTAIHGGEMVYRYKFSEVPFEEIPAVSEDLTHAIDDLPAIDPSSASNLARSLTANERATKVDIFGSYPNYSPLVFDSILEPVAKEWLAMPAQGRQDFWRWRRARPLAAALPMGLDERRAMVGGWFAGQIVGQLRIPAAPYTSPVEIWDGEVHRWLAFPHPLLTPPDTAYTRDVGFATYDWLPAVLESILVAIARAHEGTLMESLRPYRVLRSLYDAGSGGPASGLLEGSAKGLIAGWLRSGESGTGSPSRVPGVVAGQTVDVRVALVAKWLTGIKDLAGREFLAAGQSGAPGGGAFSSISSREQASRMPIFHDLAEDVFVQVSKLLELLPQAAAMAADAPEVASPPPMVPPAGLRAPSNPEGGVF